MRQISSKKGGKELEDRVYKADQEDRTDKMDKELVDKTDKVDKELEDKTDKVDKEEVGGWKSWKEAMRIEGGHKSPPQWTQKQEMTLPR